MSNPIDTKVVSKLAEILDKTNLTKLEYEDEACKITLSRQVNGIAATSYIPAAPVQPAPIAPASLPANTEETVVTEEAVSQVEDYTNSPNAVKSPMVGVVYLSSDPNAANYVNVGDVVAAGDTVCLIEAMKTFNPVKAHKGGRITKILVESGDPVEYGAPLVVIE